MRLSHGRRHPARPLRDQPQPRHSPSRRFTSLKPATPLRPRRPVTCDSHAAAGWPPANARRRKRVYASPGGRNCGISARQPLTRTGTGEGRDANVSAAAFGIFFPLANHHVTNTKMTDRHVRDLWFTANDLVFHAFHRYLSEISKSSLNTSTSFSSDRIQLLPFSPRLHNALSKIKLTEQQSKNSAVQVLMDTFSVIEPVIKVHSISHMKNHTVTTTDD